jgi:hypothetical protein
VHEENTNINLSKTTKPHLYLQNKALNTRIRTRRLVGSFLPARKLKYAMTINCCDNYNTTIEVLELLLLQAQNKARVFQTITTSTRNSRLQLHGILPALKYNVRELTALLK